MRLEPLTRAHAPDLLPVARDDDVWRFLTLPQPQDAAAMGAVVDAAAADSDRLALAVVVDGRSVGSTSGTVRDSAYFSVLAAEWPGVRAGLDARLA